MLQRKIKEFSTFDRNVSSKDIERVVFFFLLSINYKPIFIYLSKLVIVRLDRQFNLNKQFSLVFTNSRRLSSVFIYADRIDLCHALNG